MPLEPPPPDANGSEWDAWLERAGRAPYDIDLSKAPQPKLRWMLLRGRRRQRAIDQWFGDFLVFQNEARAAAGLPPVHREPVGEYPDSDIARAMRRLRDLDVGVTAITWNVDEPRLICVTVRGAGKRQARRIREACTPIAVEIAVEEVD